MRKMKSAVNRRTVLSTIGVGSLALVGGAGTASARRGLYGRGYAGPLSDPCGTCAPEPVCEPETFKYDVTIWNLTNGQPWTPPAVAIHNRRVKLFQVGTTASPEMIKLAKDADLGPMKEMLQSEIDCFGGVFAMGFGDDALVADCDPLQTGLKSKTTIQIETIEPRGVLSMASMMLATNDGFAGVDSVRLPIECGETLAVPIEAFDVGCECNTEVAADLVPEASLLTNIPQSDLEASSEQDLIGEGFIQEHPGIGGYADLTVEEHGWTGPVGLLTVTLVDPCCAEEAVSPCQSCPEEVDPCADPCAEEVDPCADPCAEEVDPCADPCAEEVDPCAEPACPTGVKRGGYRKRTKKTSRSKATYRRSRY
ncbi:spondin domain-containing protein [Haloarchaeobius sp. TZWWS8]|uniref:spondin domain-containing protein n=1 Tax=Haloarchaeobius sp. TZWWS8 TaxID=3446121 RepID=UPI003EBE6DB3